MFFSSMSLLVVATHLIFLGIFLISIKQYLGAVLVMAAAFICWKKGISDARTAGRFFIRIHSNSAN